MQYKAEVLFTDDISEGAIINELLSEVRQLRNTMPDEKVNHPAHYGGEDNPYEAIKVIEAHKLNFNLGNACKYILRAGKKSRNRLEDINKAIWYLKREANVE